MGQSSGLSPRTELNVISGSPGVSPSRVFIGRGDVEKVMTSFIGKALKIRHPVVCQMSIFSCEIQISQSLREPCLTN